MNIANYKQRIRCSQCLHFLYLSFGCMRCRWVLYNIQLSLSHFTSYFMLSFANPKPEPPKKFAFRYTLLSTSTKDHCSGNRSLFPKGTNGCWCLILLLRILIGGSTSWLRCLAASISFKTASFPSFITCNSLEAEFMSCFNDCKRFQR